MDPLAPISDITDLENEDNICRILRLSMTLRPDYWRRYIGKLVRISCNLNIGAFSTPELIEERTALLKNLLRYINKATVPPTDLLDKIPRFAYEDTTSIFFDGCVPDESYKKHEIAKDRGTIFLEIIKPDKKEKSLYTLVFDDDGHTEFTRLVDTYRRSMDLDEEDLVSHETLMSMYDTVIESFTYICDYCEDSAFSRCASCGVAYYCSKDHQDLHWKDHKKECRNVRLQKLSLTYLIAKIQTKNFSKDDKDL